MKKTKPRATPPRVDLLEFESKAHRLGFKCIVGVDEAGRGPLAGPVFAAACRVPPGVVFPGINDSKLLTPRLRRALYQELCAHPEVTFAVGIAEVSLIDEINIYQATKVAMISALDGLSERPDYLLVDAMELSYHDITCEALIGGDRRSQSIAAASIIAKERRDDLMREYHEQYPHYGFDEHKGYGTKNHLEALDKWGPCPLHRRSFEPVKSMLFT